MCVPRAARAHRRPAIPHRAFRSRHGAAGQPCSIPKTERLRRHRGSRCSRHAELASLGVVPPNVIVTDTFFSLERLVTFGEGGPVDVRTAASDGTISSTAPARRALTRRELQRQTARWVVTVPTPPPATKFQRAGLLWTTPTRDRLGGPRRHQGHPLFVSWVPYDTDCLRMWLFPAGHRCPLGRDS